MSEINYKLEIINTDKEYSKYDINAITSWLKHFKIEYNIIEIPIENPKEYKVSENIFKMYNNFLKLHKENNLLKCKIFRDILVLMNFKFPEDYTNQELLFSKHAVIEKSIKLICNE